MTYGKDHGNLAGLEAWGGIRDGPLFPLFRADESVRVLVLLTEGQHLRDGKRALTGSKGRAAGFSVSSTLAQYVQM